MGEALGLADRTQLSKNRMRNGTARIVVRAQKKHNL
jgi:hypothetical protein